LGIWYFHVLLSWTVCSTYTLVYHFALRSWRQVLFSPPLFPLLVLCQCLSGENWRWHVEGLTNSSPSSCPLSKKGGHIALLLSVCLSVGRSSVYLSTKFPFISFALVVHTQMKFGIQIYQ
jgi:hypothetical protein